MVAPAVLLLSIPVIYINLFIYCDVDRKGRRYVHLESLFLLWQNRSTSPVKIAAFFCFVWWEVDLFFTLRKTKIFARQINGAIASMKQQQQQKKRRVCLTLGNKGIVSAGPFQFSRKHHCRFWRLHLRLRYLQQSIVGIISNSFFVDLSRNRIGILYSY